MKSPRVTTGKASEKSGFAGQITAATPAAVHAQSTRIQLHCAVPKPVINSLTELPANACALVTHDLHPYGAQRLMAALVTTLAEEHQAPMELISFGGGSLAVNIRRLLPIHMTGVVWKAQSRNVELLVETLYRRGYRRAILNTVIAGIAAPMFARRGFTVLSLVHEMPTLISAEGLTDRLRAIHEHSDAVVYPHASARDAITAAIPQLPAARRVHCIGQGLVRRNPHRNDKAAVRSALRAELGIAADCPIMLGVGSGNERKGLDLFLAAATRINATGPNACFIWIGPPDPELVAQWDRQKPQLAWLSNMVRMPGFVEETARFHAAADLFFLSSREDPFPFVALESLDAGVPIIAFRGSGGGADLAENVSGAVVTPGDDQALDAMLLGWLGDAPRLAAASAAAARFADDECSFSRYVQRLLDIFDDVEAQRPPGTAPLASAA